MTTTHDSEASMAETPEAGQADEQPTDAAEDLKSQFRAALERKRGADEARAVRGHGGAAGKVHEHSRRAGGKRAFRRKSG